MYKCILILPAKEDIKEAAKWYNDKQVGLGKRFTTQVRNSIKFIQLNPMTSSIRYDNVRTALIDVFPFMIHYSIDKNKIIISAVLHTSRNPDLWK